MTLKVKNYPTTVLWYELVQYSSTSILEIKSYLNFNLRHTQEKANQPTHQGRNAPNLALICASDDTTEFKSSVLTELIYCPVSHLGNISEMTTKSEKIVSCWSLFAYSTFRNGMLISTQLKGTIKNRQFFTNVCINAICLRFKARCSELSFHRVAHHLYIKHSWPFLCTHMYLYIKSKLHCLMQTW